MSDLLSQASLVMIPSGYKEDVVYSPIPTSGAGDLSFTRASNGTRINSAGLVEVTPWNAMQYSEDFTNAVYNKYNNITASADQTTAPNGTNTADKIGLSTASTTFPNLGQDLSFINGQVYTFSVYLKKNTINFGKIRLGGTAFASSTNSPLYNLNTGVLVSGTGTIESMGNGWYRCTMTATAEANANGGFAIDLPDSAGVWNGSSVYNVNDSIFAWGYQANIGSTAKPYFLTTDRLNVPRLTYQNGGGGCPSLLLEKQSTNLMFPSEDFTNANWTGSNYTIVANDLTSPDGTQSADKFTTTSTIVENYMRISNISILANIGSSYTTTIFAKKGTGNFLRIRNLFVTNGGTNGNAWFNLNTGAVGTVQSSQTASIQDMGNGWYRCSLTGVVGLVNSFSLIDFGFTNADATNFPSSNVNGYIWGAQFELSTYPTSYIPTTSASATRVADACSKTGISSLIGQTEGVLFVDLVITGTTGNNRFSISDGSNVNWIFIATPEDGGTRASRFYIKTNGVVRVDVGTSSYFTIGQRYKLALAYKSGNWAVYGNGTLLYSGTDSIASVSSPLSVFNFFNVTGGTADCGEQINQAILFTTRLTNAELASLTTL